MSQLQQFTNFRSATPLTEDQLRRYAPSIFAPAPHASRSERYTYIPTIDVVRALVRENFQPMMVARARSRVAGLEHSKHMLRFRRPGVSTRNVGDVFPEVVLINSHDGSSSYNLMSGLFRLVCLNGMVVSDGSVDAVRVPHKGDVIDRVIEGSYRVIGESVQALEAPEKWSQIELSDGERRIFANAALQVRFGDGDGHVSAPVTADKMLAPVRAEDTGKDLWTTFNIVQEHATKGGLRGHTTDARGRLRRTTTRPVQGIDGDVKLNRALWTLAQEMARLKTA